MEDEEDYKNGLRSINQKQEQQYKPDRKKKKTAQKKTQIKQWYNTSQTRQSDNKTQLDIKKEYKTAEKKKHTQ